MKKFFISIVLCVALMMVSPLNCLADTGKTLTILYSGNIGGNITPVRG
ncbi:hypothetical protein QUF80_23090 [Desulfococcaceae bacterium HSG8]|nr:hypothetical protein [Desulfococcaceae bacterium HSG8]